MHIRSPEFGNTQVLDNNQIVRHNLGGGLLVAYDPSWPKTEVFRYEVRGLNLATKNAFVGYQIANAGQLVTLVDFENVTWEGIIKSPLTITDVHGEGCSFIVSFEFEGNIK